MELILLILLIVFLVGSLPAWPYSRGWGFNVFGVIAVLLLIYLLLALMGHIVILR